MDVLQQILVETRTRGIVACTSELGDRWGLSFPAGERAGFHVVFRGECWLRLERAGSTPLRVGAGDLVLLPGGAGHSLSDEPRGRTKPLAEVLAAHQGDPQRLRLGRGEPHTLLLCGAYCFEAAGPHPVLSLLPAAVHLPRDGTARDEIGPVLALLQRELLVADPAHAMVRGHLVDLLLVYALRRWLAEQPEGHAGWLGAIRDERIGRAIAAIHEDPAHDWSLESLAEHSGMSRAVFARRFHALVGEPPAAYLARRRMDVAARRLREGDEGLAEIARAVGYESEFAFNKAFKRVRGVPPGEYRRVGG